MVKKKHISVWGLKETNTFSPICGILINKRVGKGNFGKERKFR